MANFTGTTGNDTLQGGTSDDVLDGLAGNDNLNGLAGNDTLNGGDGDDYFLGGSGNDVIGGGAAFDIVSYSSTENDGGTKQPTGMGVTVNLQTGTATDNWGDTDTLTSIETVIGSVFNDILIGGNPANGSGATDGFEAFRGLGGNDTINGGTGFDRVLYDNSPLAVTVTLGGTANGTAQDGWGGTDILINIEEVRGSAFNDTLTGSDSGAYEAFEGRAGNDTIDGKGGTDRVIYTTSVAGVNVNLKTGVALDGFGGTDTLRNLEEVGGSNFDDILTGGNPANGSGATDGYEGFRGLGGNDTIDGGTGFDRVLYDNSPLAVTVTLGGTVNGTAQDGWGGTDILINIEEVRGSAFSDTLTGSDSGIFESFEGRAGNDLIDGKGGFDRANYSNSLVAVTVNLATGVAQDGWGGTDTLINIEEVWGSSFNDTLTGSDLGSYESFEGRAGNDVIDGKGGFDRANYSSSLGAVTVNLATGVAQDGWGGTDTLRNMEGVRGSSFNDTITGDDGSNVLEGGVGNDALDGGAGTDSSVYAGARSNYMVTKTAAGLEVVSILHGSDSLVGMERLQFTDGKLAFDTAGAAGHSALLLGALVGKESVQNKALVGQVLGLADGGLNLAGLSALAVSSGVTTSLAGGADDTSFAKMLSRNLLGTDTNQSVVDLLTGLLTSGSFTQSTLLAAAAELDINKVNIDLVGLSQIGLAYA